MGEAGTGKSCLIKRYCEEKFVAKYISTIGVDFGGECRPRAPVELQPPAWPAAMRVPYPAHARLAELPAQSNQSWSTTTK